MKRLLLALVAIAFAVTAFAASSASMADRYDGAMRRYRANDYTAAAAAFRSIVDEDVKDPLTLKSRYFLARALMKSGSWRDAQKEIVAIYETSPSFYGEWACDFLLGECRRALGEDQ